MTRTFEAVTVDDLREIRGYALSELERFLNGAGTPPGKYRRYADRLVGVCLGQGAAQHFIALLNSQACDVGGGR